MSASIKTSVLVAVAVLVGAVAAAAPIGPPEVIDPFEDVSDWKAFPADGVELGISAGEGVVGQALRLDFHFTGGGYAVAHKDVDLDLPDNYAFTFRIRGQAPSNHLEFKLIDDTGANVWWCVHRDVQFSPEWTTFTIKKRHISFAWGPKGGGDIGHVAAIEFAITAGSGGTGTVWLDQLTLKPLAPSGAKPPPPVASATSGDPTHPPAAAIDGDLGTAWVPAPVDRAPGLMLDLRIPREFGGITLRWVDGRAPRDYDVEASDDGTQWRLLQHVAGSNGGRDDLFLPESEAGHLRIGRLRGGPGDGVALAEVVLQPLEWSATREAFFAALAREAPRGSYPRGITGEQSFWTVVGQDEDLQEVLFNEDGMIETGKKRCSLEPFIYIDAQRERAGHLITWSDVEASQSLAEDALPVPTVRWQHPEVQLTVTALPIGAPGASSIVVRYTVSNPAAQRLRGNLLLAVRPFQTNPPSQGLNTPGGTAPLRVLQLQRRRLHADDRTLTLLTPPSEFGAATFQGGDVVTDFLRRGKLPDAKKVDDPFEAASGALAYRFDLHPGQQREVIVVVPLYPDAPRVTPMSEPLAHQWVEQQLGQACNAWRSRIDGSATAGGRIQLPPAGAHLLNTLRSQLGYILVNRAGPAIQPGARAYARSWIRDGSLTSSALLRVGQADAARAFLEWYAPHQYPSGKVPCVVDSRGADPTPEHDSDGEFIFLVAETYRYTGDHALAQRMWPRVEAAATYLDSLRQQRRTDEYLDMGLGEFYGLLPPSISHEGYSAKPMHSYWDDFFAYKGFADAAFLAGELGNSAAQARWAAVRDEFGHDLRASVDATQRVHGIDFVPGCADMGDFDATSTTIALSPTNAAALLAPESVQATFERYWQNFVERRDGGKWDAYTPYEMRNVGAFVRLGWRERAHELLDWFFTHQRPAGWNHWAEVVSHEERVPRFLGDMPHTWVGSDYVRSVLDMFAYERDSDQSLVVAAGVLPAWLSPEPGVVVTDLPTRWGLLHYDLFLQGNRIVMHIGEGVQVPPGGIAVRAPMAADAQDAWVDGRRVYLNADREAIIRKVPATIVLRP